jgi:Zn-dependent protease
MLRERLKEISKTSVNINFSFLLVLFFFLYSFGIQGIWFTLFFFCSIILHEVGHMFIGLKHGLPVVSINFNFLGASVLFRSKELFNLDYKKIISISLAGPAVSIILSIIFSALYLLVSNELTYFLAIVNILSGILNLFPIMPLDGGIALFVLLKEKYGKEKALKYIHFISGIFCAVSSLVVIYFGLYPMVVLFFGLFLLSYCFKVNF